MPKDMGMRLHWLMCLFLYGLITLSNAQNLTTDTTVTPTPTSSLSLSMPPTVTQCTELNITWSGGMPWWSFSWQLSKGPIGDASSLSHNISWQFDTDYIDPFGVPLDFNPHQSK
jgi:hypothetical protein